MATDTKKRMATDALKEDTAVAQEAAAAVASASNSSQGTGLDEYIDYLNDYDRSARGAGASRDTDRFSGLDIRHVHDAAADFGVSEADAANEVLKYARRIEDETKMGGKAQAALDKLRGIEGDEVTTPNPIEDPISNDPVAPTEPVADAPVDVDFGSGGIDFGGGGIRPPAEIPVFGTTPGLAGGQYVMQDNDQQSSVVGNNNNVNQAQDNSINAYTPRTSSWKQSWMQDYFS